MPINLIKKSYQNIKIKRKKRQLDFNQFSDYNCRINFDFRKGNQNKYSGPREIKKHFFYYDFNKPCFAAFNKKRNYKIIKNNKGDQKIILN